MSCSLKRLTMSAALMTVTALLVLSSAHATIEGGNARRGKDLAREKCKHCHVQGAAGGTMTALSKTQRQWARFFKKEKHLRIAPGAWAEISPDELKDIQQYLHDHAADSEQPETCGK